MVPGPRRDADTAPTTGGGSSGDSSEAAATAAASTWPGRASAKAPSTAPPNQDVNGKQVSYDASNMLDGVPTTAWRAPGDATGMALTFTLPEPTELPQVGLINGYAKTSTDASGREFDWYRGNRRVDAVVWVFDDGTKVRQQLDETREHAARRPAEAGDHDQGRRHARARCPRPARATPGRDFTAVSEVSLFGVPASARAVTPVRTAC